MERTLTHSLAGPSSVHTVRAGLQARPASRAQPLSAPRPARRAVASVASLATDGGLAERSLTVPNLGAGEHQPRITLVHSPAEFEDLCAAAPGLVVLMCKAASCRPCKAFARKYARASEKYTDTAFVEIYGDETKDTRAMMVSMKIRVTPTFVLFRGRERVYSWGGVSEANFHKGVTEHLAAGEAGFGTFNAGDYPADKADGGHH